MPNQIVPLINIQLKGATNAIKETIIDHGGTIAAAVNDFNTIKAAANFNKFDPAYLDGATNLSQINSFGQFRNYGSLSFQIWDYEAPNVAAFGSNNNLDFRFHVRLFQGTTLILIPEHYIYRADNSIGSPQYYPVGTNDTNFAVKLPTSLITVGTEKYARIMVNIKRLKELNPLATKMQAGFMMFSGNNFVHQALVKMKIKNSVNDMLTDNHYGSFSTLITPNYQTATVPPPDRYYHIYTEYELQI